ncbi:MAG: hypothetical protein Q7S40_03560 [Opitutaceae bacterium]|nr:hypothetical protein [Opitutaceae bacterium]
MTDTETLPVPFDNRLEEINGYLDKRRGALSLRGWGWDDIRQAILIRVWQQYEGGKYDPTSGPFGQWVNRVISNTLRNLYRDNYGKFAPPCGKCEHNTGGTSCGLTPSGNKCAECPLYKTWQRIKGAKYAIRLPFSLDDVLVEGVEFANPAPPQSQYDMPAMQRAIDRLDPESRDAVQTVLASKSVLAASGKIGVNWSTLDKRLAEIAPVLWALYNEELDGTRLAKLKLMDEVKQTMQVTITHNVPLPPRLFCAAKYPFEEMKVGDSFFAAVLGARLAKNAEYYRKKGGGGLDKKFSVRKAVENGIHGARIWRLE